MLNMKQVIRNIAITIAITLLIGYDMGRRETEAG